MRLLTHGATAVLTAAMSIGATLAWTRSEAKPGMNPERCAGVDLTASEIERISQAVVEKMQIENLELIPTRRIASGPAAAVQPAPQEKTTAPPEPDARQERALEDAKRLVDVMVTTKTIDREHIQQLRRLISSSEDPQQFHPIVGQLLAAINRGEIRPPDGDPTSWLP